MVGIARHSRSSRKADALYVRCNHREPNYPGGEDDR